MTDWRVTLEGSIRALYNAADEYRAALLLAQTGQWTFKIERLLPADGRISATSDKHPGGMLRPHDSAVFHIGDMYRGLATSLQEGYERAALMYAYGVVWASAEIIHGRTPGVVQVRYGDDGKPAPGLRPRIGEHLTRWNDYDRYMAAEGDLIRCEIARDAGNELSTRTYLADHEAGQMARAFDDSRDLAHAAFNFAIVAERALIYTINARLMPSRGAHGTAGA